MFSTTGDAPTAAPTVDRRLVRAMQVVGWTFVVLAAGHLTTETAAALADPDPAMSTATAAMEAVVVPLPGPRTHSTRW